MEIQLTKPEGSLPFTVESILLRELGERLVKRPEVALIELIKNSYDADATECKIYSKTADSITICDDGVGMTLDQFQNGWLRIGTQYKSENHQSLKYLRDITGEKGVGRFSVRFLGYVLNLKTIALDPKLGHLTQITSEFDWREIDKIRDIDKTKVHYKYHQVDQSTSTGTTLEISSLRVNLDEINYQKIRTSTLSLKSPIFNLISTNKKPKVADKSDPGFAVVIQENRQQQPFIASEAVLNAYSLRATVKLVDKSLELAVFDSKNSKPIYKIIDTFQNSLKKLTADIRFFPKRKGVFTNLPVNANDAYKYIKENSGVSVYDRGFRIEPYGNETNDWLELQLDAGKGRRKPRSSIAKKHFDEAFEAESIGLRNWMLKLPKTNQLIGIVEVEGMKSSADSELGLIAPTDREGFIENETFSQLFDIVRGATEAIAYFDKKIQLDAQKQEQEALLSTFKRETQQAIIEVQENPNIEKDEKKRLITVLSQTFERAEKQDELAREREQRLEVMSLLGIVAGYMTHEFGVAVYELEQVRKECLKLAKKSPKFNQSAIEFEKSIQTLKDFAMYTAGYIHGAKHTTLKKYPVKPRVTQVIKYFGEYANSRNIEIINEIDSELFAPLVPAALYNGIALNLYTNAIKAITAKISNKTEKIVFRAWDEPNWHVFEVLDSGIGIPSAIKDRVFEPFFTTTDINYHPLGSGMGLGLALIQRVVKAFGGHVDFHQAPTGFSTRIQVKLPLVIKN